MPAIKNQVLGTARRTARAARRGAKWSKRRTLAFIVVCSIGFWCAIAGAIWGVYELLR